MWNSPEKKRAIGILDVAMLELEVQNFSYCLIIHTIFIMYKLQYDTLIIMKILSLNLWT